MLKRAIVKIGLGVPPRIRRKIRSVPFVGPLMQRKFREGVYQEQMNPNSWEMALEAIDALEFRIIRIERELLTFRNKLHE